MGSSMRIEVEVKASSRVDEVFKVDEKHYIVKVSAPRQKGKANAALLKLLRKHFGRPVIMISGFTSTTKIIEVEE
jgi:uncharacterized protein (TIGR00251 family)